MNNPPKHPPHSIEGEMSVLGGIMLANSMADDVFDIVTTEDFYQASHRLIFEAIKVMIQSGREADFITVSQHLDHAGDLQEAGGLSYLGSLVNDTPSAANVKAYARIVRERAAMRSLIACGQEIAESGFRPEGRSAGELLVEAEAAVSKLADRAAHGGRGLQPAEFYQDRFESALEAARKAGGEVSGLPTGFIDLDKLTTGLHAGELIVVAARPSMGKSAFALAIAANNTLVEHGKVGAIFTMEMPGEQINMRLSAMVGKVRLQGLRTGQLQDDEWSRLSGAGYMLRTPNLHIDDDGNLSINQVRARCKGLKRRRGRLDYVIVDYLQLMAGAGEKRHEQIGSCSRGLKALAKELECPVIALSQINRAVDGRESKRPRMSDLRESGDIEQDADVIMFLYRDEVYDENSPFAGTAEVIIGKQRNGPLGSVRLAFNGPYGLFENLSHQWEAPAKPKRKRGLRADTAVEPDSRVPD